MDIATTASSLPRHHSRHFHREESVIKMDCLRGLCNDCVNDITLCPVLVL